MTILGLDLLEQVLSLGPFESCTSFGYYALLIVLGFVFGTRIGCVMDKVKNFIN